ncbi:MAG: hypothetical protein GNW80_16135 [Asgard group archaeon]|nr:hypothetical protein [Asgard group archaeon]
MDLEQEIDLLIKFNDINPKDMIKEDWLDDFNSFYNLMKENYPYFQVKERMLGYNWLDLKDNYLKRLEEAKDVKEYLSIFYDAVVALQDSHTSIQLSLDYFYQNESFKQLYLPKFATIRKIFSDKLQETDEYWKPIMQEYYTERNHLDYETLILYSKGKYLLLAGVGNWEEKYGFGSVITAVNSTPIDETIKGTYEKDYLYWDTKRKKPYQLYIDPKMFGQDAKFTLKTRKGEIKEVTFDTSTEYNLPSISNYPSEIFTTKIWARQKIAYIRFGNFEPENYDKETTEYLYAFFKKVRDFNHLIIDIRGNSGGDPDVWVANIVAPLTKKKLVSKQYAAYRNGKYVNMFRKDWKRENEISKDVINSSLSAVLSDDYTVYDLSILAEPLGEINFKAKISVLVDHKTYSAATSFTLFCKDTSFAKVYGTPNKGEGVCSGPTFYVLPNSKIVIRFFSALGFDSKGNACEEVKVQPDIYYESELRDFDELLYFVFGDLQK